MRVLLLLRGSPGCGKSTWIREHGLETYTLSADQIRLMCSAPQMTEDAQVCINQNNDKVVWEMLFRMLEVRMQAGEFTVIDATNSKTAEIKRYKVLCERYKYRIFCVDFTHLPIEVAKKRNRNRETLKRVPEDVIDKMYSRFATQQIPSGITVIQPDQLDQIWMRKYDVSFYRCIHVFGDIHGCYTALMEYFDTFGEMKDDELYIFLGDYVDRGLENAEVMQFLLSVYKKNNVICLEGNHEQWLWHWANDEVCASKEFEFVTKTQLEKAGLDKKEVRLFYRRCGQCAWFTYGGNEYLLTHGGLSTMPENLTLVATQQMIKGVGTYRNVTEAETSFLNTTHDHCYQIHGHRNISGGPIQTNARNFNLEGHIEFGGYLRVVQLLPDGTQQTVQIQNKIFKGPEEIGESFAQQAIQQTVGDTIIALRKSKYINEKQFGNISSFNFSKDAFYNKAWNAQTTKARGLYINIPQQKIVARSYDKFFNIGERPETELEMLQYSMTFPLTAYVKENGFLGIVSYNEEDDSLLVASKAFLTGDYALWMREALERELVPEQLEQLKHYTKEHNVSFVFECVDMKHDPHIIAYPENRLYLLDIVYNEMPFRKYSYDEMCVVANQFLLRHKERAYVIENWQEFLRWYDMVLAPDYRYNDREIEGFVLEDTKDHMVKLKLAYYTLWKHLRSVAWETLKYGYLNPKRTGTLTTALENRFYGWVKSLYTTDEEEKAKIPLNICSLRQKFFETDIGKEFV